MPIVNKGVEDYMKGKEVMFECNHVSLHEDRPVGPSAGKIFSFLIFDRRNRERFIIDYKCVVIYMNNNGKTIDRKLFDENGIEI